MKKCDEIVVYLKSLANPKNVEGMARYGINPNNTLGISIPVLRSLAKKSGRDQKLAEALWKTGIHEARILAALVAEPDRITKSLMELWVRDFDSWDVCDGVCMNLFDKTPFAYDKAIEWSKRKQEFVKRAGFALMASLAVHDKKAKDSQFDPFLAAIARESTDERNFVKKAVNWALRQIGKRNIALNKKAITAAEKISKLDSKAARWIAKDAQRELTGEKVKAKLSKPI